MPKAATENEPNVEGQVEDGQVEGGDSNVEDAETPAPTNVERLTAEVANAKTALETAHLKLMEAAPLGVLKDTMEAMEAVQSAKRTLDRAESSLTAATYELRNEERMEFSIELKAAVDNFLAGIDTVRMAELSLTGIHITVDKENPSDPTVSIVAAGKPAGQRTTSSTRTPGATRGKALVRYEGETYTGREFIEKFGGEDGQKALHKASNYKEYGLANSPGFDAFKKALVKKLGAEIIEE